MADQYAALRSSTYKVWHIPQIPGEAFMVETESLDEAKRLVDVLADYDLFQLEHNIKPDYANMNGILVWSVDEDGYVDWEDEDQ